MKVLILFTSGNSIISWTFDSREKANDYLRGIGQDPTTVTFREWKE